MNPLSSIYGGVARLRNAAYDRGWRRIHRLAGPVVSVGNVSTGGSGKTPFVMTLGEALKRRDIKFDVLSRGYGRKTQGTRLVDPAGSAAEYGDEPLLIARKLQIAVIVGEDRYAAGRYAEERFGPQLHLLDDGFQHRRLARDFDIVILSEGDIHDQLLPAGRLREPMDSLQRADAIVLEGDMEMPRETTGKMIWRIRRGIDLDCAFRRPIAFCGIARPQRFFDQLHEHGVEPAATRVFRDHHAYTTTDVQSLLAQKARCGADGFICTEKDETNLGAAKELLQPFAVARVTMDLSHGDDAMDALLKAIPGRHRRS